MEPRSQGRKYDAFISYNYGSDAPLAEALREEIPRFAKPLFRRASANIFLDKTNLAPSSRLWSSIASHLDDSAHFILIASSSAAKSGYVKQELVYWLTEGKSADPDTLDRSLVSQDRVDRLLLTLSEGEIIWDRKEGDFDWDRTTALPTLLCGVYEENPKWVELRTIRNQGVVPDRKSKDFIGAVALLSVPIRKLDLPVLIGKDYQEHRRTLRIAGFAISLLSILLLGVISLLAVSLYFVAEERQQRLRADRLGRMTEARRLEAEARNALPTSTETALLLAIEAVQATKVDNIRLPAAEGVLRLALSEAGSEAIGPARSTLPPWVDRDGRRLVTFSAASGDDSGLAEVWDLDAPRVPPARLRKPLVGGWSGSADRRYLASHGANSPVRVWDLTRFRPDPIELPAAELPFAELAFGADGRRLVGFNPPPPPPAKPGPNASKIWVWDLERPGTKPIPIRLPGEAPVDIAIDPDGRWIAVVDSKEYVSVRELSRPDQELGRWGPPTDRIQPLGMTRSVAFGRDGRLIATGVSDAVRAWDMRHPEAGAVQLAGLNPLKVLLSPDARRLCTTENGQAFLHDLGSPDSKPLALPNLPAAYSRDGRRIAVAQDGGIAVWDLQEGKPTHQFPLAGGFAQDLGFSQDGRRLALGDVNGLVRVWDIDANPSRPPIELRGLKSPITSVTFHADGSRVIAVDRDQARARVWNIKRPTVIPIPYTGGPARGEKDGFDLLVTSHDGRRMVTNGPDRTFLVWDLGDPLAVPRTIPGGGLHGYESEWLFVERGRWLVWSDRSPNAPPHIHAWDLDAPGAMPRVLDLGPGTGETKLERIPGGDRLLTVDRSAGLAREWDLSRWQATPFAPSVLEPNDSLVFDPMGRWVVFSGWKSGIRRWDRTHPEMPPRQLRPPEEWSERVAFDPQGKALVVGGSGSQKKSAQIWRLEDPSAPVHNLADSAQDASILTFIEGGRRILQYDSEGTLRAWVADKPGQKPEKIFGRSIPLDQHRFRGDGRSLLTIEPGGVYCWDLSRLSDERVLIKLFGEKAQYPRAAFCLGDMAIVTSGSDGVEKWPLNLAGLVDLAKTRAGRNFTTAEWDRYFPDQDYPRTVSRPPDPDDAPKPGPGPPGSGPGP